MEIVFKEAKTLKEFIDILSTLEERVTIVAEPEGLHSRVTDPGHAALVDVFIPKAAFTKYEAANDAFQYNVTALKRELEEFKPKQPASLEILTDGKVYRGKFGQGVLTYRQKLAPPAAFPFPSYYISYPTWTLLPTEVMRQAIKAANEANVKEIVFHLTPGKFECTFTAKEDTITVEYPLSNPAKFNCKEHICVPFSVLYMKALIDAIPSDEVKLYLKNNNPLMLEFNLSNNAGKAVYILAPRKEKQQQ